MEAKSNLIKTFGSDNNSGVHPIIFAAIEKANKGSEVSYGADPYTARAIKLLKKEFGKNTEIFLSLTGTASNVMAFKAIAKPYHAIIASESSHISVDECAAVEHFTGCKILTVATTDGKLTIDLINRHMHSFGDEHRAQPKIISITQSTELGSVYSQQELKKLCDFAHQHEMLVHMDGARLFNAAAYLNKSLREITVDVGVDVLSLGGTKNGALCAEAVLFFDPSLASGFKYIRKQAMQLYSKMRFLAVQFEALFMNNLWLDNANNANAMAQLLGQELAAIKQIKLARPVQGNGVFAIMPKEMICKLHEHYYFYVWNEQTDEVRLMTSFNTTRDEVMAFVAVAKEYAR